MDKTTLKFLQGFSSYDRSYNRRVLADDTEIQEAYQRAEEIGKLPFNRTKILIVGDHAAGKTSTCRRLQGKEFRQGEPSTVGIETNTVKSKVHNVNSKWCEVKYTPREDYESSAAWWAVSRVYNQSKGKLNVSKNQGLNQQITGNILYLMKALIPILITFLFGGFRVGFGWVALIYIVCLTAVGDVYSSYRYGFQFVIQLMFIDSAVSTIINSSVEENRWTNFYIAIMIVIYGLVSLATGVLFSYGRLGICIAFCLMIHPKQKLFTSEYVTETIINFYNDIYLELLIFIITFLSYFLFQNFHVKILSLGRRKLIFILVILSTFVSGAMFIESSDFLCKFIFTSLSIVVIIASNISGLLIGRKLVAYRFVPQNYFIKKFAGFIAGLFVAVFCGWKFIYFKSTVYHDIHNICIEQLVNVFLEMAPIIVFIAYEWYGYKKVKYCGTMINQIRESLLACSRKQPYLDARLNLWDFAGQEMYYNTHHLFMPSQGVYLVLFNTIEAVMNPVKSIKRLQFWLQSIAMHAEIENVVVFLVGTRRKGVRDSNMISCFDGIAKEHLYKRFCKLLAFHPSGKLCFFIENSSNVDEELKLLREVIYNEVKELKFFQESFSIKYLLFKDTLNKFRKEKCIITSLKCISEEVKTKCNIISHNELCHFLSFFDKSGDIVYKERDELLRYYVICDPQVLIDILKILVNVPEPHQRNRNVADFWQVLKQTGIVDSRLLEHICERQGIWRLYPCVIRFLVATHLLFPLKVTNQVNQIGTFCLPCRLPKIEVSRIWISNQFSQDVYYFDFGEMLTEFIFLRLLAKCCEIFTWDEIYYNAARFKVTTDKNSDVLFLINTEIISGGVSSYRNLIKLSVENEDHVQSIKILQQLIYCTAEISNGLFNPAYFTEQYICGPECETCSFLDGALCLVNIIAHGIDISKLEAYKPDQYHKVSLKTKRTLTCNRM